jgi:hypothetical protein
MIIHVQVIFAGKRCIAPLAFLTQLSGFWVGQHLKLFILFVFFSGSSF